MLATKTKNFLKKYRVFFIAGFFMGLVGFLFPDIAGAASTNDLGMEYGNAIGLPSTDPRLVIARLIQIVLGFLGIISVALVVYGGFLWMTSAGNPEKIEKAKKVLKNAIIGLAIILSAFGITTFILNKMIEATGGGTAQTGTPSGGSAGLGAIGSCIVERVYPEPGDEEVPRNTSIIVTFKEAIDPTTVCASPSDIDADGNPECDGGNIIDDGRIKIFKSKDSPGNYVSNVRVTQTSDDKTFVFTPGEYLGSPSEYVWYDTTLTNDIEKKSNGEGAFSTCQKGFLNWQFRVSNKLDLTPPQVDNIFPQPDNEKDEVQQVSSLSFATGYIILNNNPEVFKAATSTSVIAQGSSPTNVEVDMNDSCEQGGTLLLSVQSDGVTATLENVTTGNNLGSASFNGDTVTFPGILNFTVNASFNAGNSWEIYVDPVRYPDSLDVGSDTYLFTSSSPAPNEIEVGGTVNDTAQNIAGKLDGRSDLVASTSGNTVNIRAQEGGSEGNSITLNANDYNGDGDFTVDSLSGGEDETETVNIKDKEDEPKNAIIQINFNETMNPVALSGSATEVESSIRIVNASSPAVGGGSSCTQDTDCLSFSCTSGSCDGNYLAGKFLVSNNYQTVEFQSDNQCGTNACGEDIYCLPENANIKVEIEAAQLDDCGPSNCSTRSPYTSCESAAGSISGSTCVNDQGTATTSDDINYPLSALPLTGAADAAMNSLDGNGDGEAVGPVSYYNENVGNTSDGDSYTWSFWTNDELKITAPVIESVIPTVNGTTTDLSEPVEVQFNEIMKSSSLQTGETRIDTGNSVVEHKLINIWNFSGGALGYWITKEGIEEAPQDGYPDKTKAVINHSMFGDSMSYRSQVGSGIKDIYQNCYKPSDGPACSASDTQPSCCNGSAVAGESCP